MTDWLILHSFLKTNLSHPQIMPRCFISFSTTCLCMVLKAKDGSPLKVSENGRFPHLWRHRSDNDINDINDISMTSNLSMMSMTIINNFWSNMFKQHFPSTLTSTNHICEVLRLHPWPQWARCSPRSNGECHVLGNSYRWSWMWFLFFAIFSNLWKITWEAFPP